MELVLHGQNKLYHACEGRIKGNCLQAKQSRSGYSIRIENKRETGRNELHSTLASLIVEPL